MSTHVNELMALSDFKKATNATIGGRKSLGDVDSALENWHKHYRYNLHLIHKGLVELGAHCTAYLQTKRAKLAGEKRPSGLLKKRIKAVEILAHQNYVRLAYHHHETMKQLENKRPGHQQTALGQATRAGMQAGYQHERTQFEQMGKATNPLGASFVESEQHAARNPANLQAAGVQLPANISALVQKPFGNLSFEEFRILNAFFGVHQVSGAHKQLVSFARKDERLRELMLIPINGVLFNTKGEKPSGFFIYALDKHGNLMAESSGADYGQSNLNHSTLCAGREVICAGEIGLQNGHVTVISNQSGHYKPNAARLGQAIQILNEEYHLNLGQHLTEIGEMEAQARYDSLAQFRAVVPLI